MRRSSPLLGLLLLIGSCGGDSSESTVTSAPTTIAITTTTVPPATELTTTIVAVTTTLAAPLVDLESGLLAYYPMNGDATDAGPGAMHGEVAGAVADADRMGDPAGALRFDGSLDLVILDEQGFALGESFSVTMWLKGNAASDHQWVILSDHAAGECQPSTPSWILRYDKEAGVFFSVYDSTTECGTHFGYGSPVRFDDDQWHHLALIATGGGLRLSFDCEEVMVVEASIDLPDGPYALLAGNQGGSPQSTAFDGSLDELRFYGRALEPGEVDVLCAVP